MSEVFVYVEGPSDQLGMRELFSKAINIAKQNGNTIDFYPLNGKEPIMNKGPKKALNILRNRPNSYVFLVPDLYPPNKPFAHLNFAEMKQELVKRFNDELQRRSLENRLADRFFVHCFKYDLESLILASEEALLARLDKTRFTQSWTKTVEDQNHDKPPKRIVEMLFSSAGMKYKDTADVPWILKRSRYQDLIEKCPQNFKPFVEDLFRILGMKVS
jgi:Domain of unknown function (DUF4276)